MCWKMLTLLLALQPRCCALLCASEAVEGFHTVLPGDLDDNMLPRCFTAGAQLCVGSVRGPASGAEPQHSALLCA
jgi:hypothetical protein